MYEPEIAVVPLGRIRSGSLLETEFDELDLHLAAVGRVSLDAVLDHGEGSSQVRRARSLMRSLCYTRNTTRAKRRVKGIWNPVLLSAFCGVFTP